MSEWHLYPILGYSLLLVPVPLGQVKTLMTPVLSTISLLPEIAVRLMARLNWVIEIYGSTDDLIEFILTV